jgi:hypothetical protein
VKSRIYWCAGFAAMDVDGTELFVEEDDNAAVDLRLKKPNNKAKSPPRADGLSHVAMLMIY